MLQGKEGVKVADGMKVANRLDGEIILCYPDGPV